MFIRNLKTKQVFIVPEGTTYAKTAYEVVSKEQLDKEKAARIASKPAQAKKTITKPSPKKKSSRPAKKKPSAKKKK